MDPSGRACIADFGLSAINDPQIAHWTSQSVGRKGGSTRWQAPELVDPERDEVVPNSKESDVYAWSCVCYEVRQNVLCIQKLPDVDDYLGFHWAPPLPQGRKSHRFASSQPWIATISPCPKERRLD